MDGQSLPLCSQSLFGSSVVKGTLLSVNSSENESYPRKKEPLSRS